MEYIQTATEYCERVTDGTHDTPKPTNEGYPLVTSKHISGGRLNLESAYLISEEDYMEINKRSKVDQWDILFSMIGSVGSVYLERDPNPEYAIKNIGLFKMGGNKEKALRLYYYLNSHYFQKRLKHRLSGSIQSFVSLGFLRGLKLPDLDNLNNQKLDELELVTKKIFNNEKLLSEVEEYSQLLFHKWFVEFNFPNEKGKPYRDSGGAIEEINGVNIPQGWDWTNISNVADIVDCLHSKKPENIGTDINKCLLQLENIYQYGLLNLRNLYLVTKEDYDLWTARIEVRQGDLLITNAGRVGSLAQVPEGYKFGIGRNITAIRPNSISPTWFYLYFNSKFIRTQIKKNTDQGSFFGSLNVRGIKSLNILMPTKDIETKFENYIRPFRKKMELLNRENMLLEEAVDLLIRELIN